MTANQFQMNGEISDTRFEHVRDSDTSQSSLLFSAHNIGGIEESK